MYWKDVWVYVYYEYGVGRFKEIWEMVEETNDGEKVFACAKCSCKFKTVSSLKFHCSSNTPTGREFLKTFENFFPLDLNISYFYMENFLLVYMYIVNFLLI